MVARQAAESSKTDTTFTIDDAVDGDDDDGDEALATSSSSKTIHESADVVRTAPFPAPPVIEADEASPVDWASAIPPRDQWPADLADLHANNPEAAKTWSEVEAAMQRLVLYHAVRGTSHLYICHGVLRAMRTREQGSAHARTLVAADRCCADCYITALFKVPRWQRAQ